ncbi:hypothetical protein BDB00DRAFT_878507 [Zychaea mexicana]|uniref:uncharacterized protein n=1 Tax=Zychaea mexicana TaxID=64656 RepID=UPI0022FF0D45|nr:uncharacterized protein BDB00DRAFT_878507 [Zychaea mexicana]KAI9484732.1 hypothetical protein BDB00DRAFT_878507 [Zychaea mexicana]
MLATTTAGAYYYFSNNYLNKTQNRAFADAAEAPKAFSPEEFRSFTLTEAHPYNHNTSVFRFKLPSDQHVTGLHVASCVITRYPFKKKDGSTGYIIRPYTPTSHEEEQGFVEFIIKDYPQGKMSKHIHSLNPGDTLEIKGPIPKYNWDQGKVSDVGMIAGGTGITPMLQVIRKIFDTNSKDDKTKVTLIFTNQTEDDILLREELDGYAKKYPNRFKVVYGLDRPPAKWGGHTGFVSKELIKKNLPAPCTPDSVIFVCGPDPMLAAVAGAKAPDKSQGELGGVLKELGYGQDHVYKF